MRIAVDILGWLGALFMVAAYSLISFGARTGRNPMYQTLNVIGSVLLVVNTAWHHAWPSSVVNVVWIGIALGALARGLKSPSIGGGLGKDTGPLGEHSEVSAHARRR